MGFNFAWGIVFALGSLVFNGSFSSMNKLPQVEETRINPQIFNMYFSLGVILLSLIVYATLIILGETVTFTYLGVLSGLLLAFAGIFTFAAIGKIGLSVGISIWSGTAILVSFLEGVLGDEPPKYWGFAILGVVVLVLGIVGVAFAETTAHCLCFSKQEMEDIASTIHNSSGSISPSHTKTSSGAAAAPAAAYNRSLAPQTIDEDPSQLSQTTKSYHTGTSNYQTNNITNNNNNTANNIYQHIYNPNQSITTSQNDTSQTRTSTHTTTLISNASQQYSRRHSTTSHYDEFNEELDISRWFLGIFYAMLTGIFGGSVGFPETYTDGTNAAKAKFLISFACGVAVIFPITLLYQCFMSNEPIQWHWKKTMIPGIASGILWNLGNLCSLYAIDILSYAVAYPIMQSSLVVGVIWGIFVWKEFTDYRVIGTLFFFSLVVVIGCTIITYGVQG